MSRILTNSIHPRSGNQISIGRAGDTVSIAGTLTYEDVTNVDSVGVITGRNGMHITSGNVGIGTDDPFYNFEVRGNTNTEIRIGNFDDSEAGILLSNTGSTNRRIVASGGDLIFRGGASTSVEHLRIDSNGNVGVGSTQPTDILEVATSVDGEATLATFKNTSAGGTNETVDINLGLEGNVSSSNVILRAGKEANHNSGAATDNFFAIHTTIDNTSTEKLRITGIGSVGIGTDDPVTELHVDGPSNGRSRITISRSGFLRNNFIGLDGDADELVIAADEGNAGADSHIKFKVDGSEVLLIKESVISVVSALDSVTPATGLNNGGILIRPTTVQDNTPFLAQASSTADSSAMLFANSSGVQGSIVVRSTSTQYNTTSDYRVKENFVGITGAIGRVKQLQPKRFNFISDPNTTLDGFIAHEAQTVVPESVSGEKDGESLQGMDHSKLIPLLTAALQETITKIETLEAQVAELQGN